MTHTPKTGSPEARSVDPAARQALARAGELGVATAWDRSDKLQPLCGFGELGLCCHVCLMGPCRIDPFGEGATVGACGADAHLLVARNFARAVAAGAAAHSDHGREVVEVLRLAGQGGTGYAVSNPGRLQAVAREWGLETKGRSDAEVALELASAMSGQFGEQHGPLRYVARAPEVQRARWASPRAASTARSSSSCIAPTTAWTPIRSSSCARRCAWPSPTAGAAR